eukprot:364319-Chlamydomonas_euryale.AAC.10
MGIGGTRAAMCRAAAAPRATTWMPCSNSDAKQQQRLHAASGTQCSVRYSMQQQERRAADLHRASMARNNAVQ